MQRTMAFRSTLSLAVVLIVTSVHTTPMHAQEPTPSGKAAPALSPEIQQSLDAAIEHLSRQMNAHTARMRDIERGLFATPQNILDLCRTPMRPTKHRAVLEHFRATRDDPVSLPTIDCMFMRSRSGGALLWSYEPAPDKSYYMLRAHEGMTPDGAFAFARHPLNFNHRRVLNGPDWVVTRSVFEPLDAFPLRANATLNLTEVDESRVPTTLTARVVESFPISHEVNGQIKQVETLHIVVKQLPAKTLLGKPSDRRRWYIYSEKANVFIQRSQALTRQDSINKAATGVDKNLSFVAYIKEGRYILRLTSADLAPLRGYLETFDVWAVN